jgi:hypothetical protein
MNAVGNTPKIYYADDGTDTWMDLYNAPDANVIGEHQGRLILDSKTVPDRIFYSDTFDHTKWQGVSDSGAVDFFTGDGDPEGLTGIAPPFKGSLIVGKSTRIDQLAGDDITADPIRSIAAGLGFVSHKAVVAVDMDDLIYPSKRGFHSIVATDTTGDFSSNFLSQKISGDFPNWVQTRLKYIQGAYIPTLNSAVWTIAEEGETSQNALWLFNVERKEWYRWPDIDAQSLAAVRDTENKVRLLIGTGDGRIAFAQRGTHTDYTAGAINFRVKSGTIYVDNSPQTLKMFKRVTFYFRPVGDYSFTTYFKVDNQSPQALTFSQTADADTLGGEFILGTSMLGNSATLAPYTQQVEGVGRGCSLEVFQSGVEAQVEIYGYSIEYELADVADEVQE